MEVRDLIKRYREENIRMSGIVDTLKLLQKEVKGKAKNGKILVSDLDEFIRQLHHDCSFRSLKNEGAIEALSSLDSPDEPEVSYGDLKEYVITNEGESSSEEDEDEEEDEDDLYS